MGSGAEAYAAAATASLSDLDAKIATLPAGGGAQ
jgi:hypothetical protein